MCMLGFGSYFCGDIPAALQDNFKNDLKISTTTFTEFYAWGSWPNVILCFFGGYLIDRVFGIRLGAILFSLLVFIGQIVFACGALFNLIWLMDLGRSILGIGSESLAVAQNAYAVTWFFGRELNLVFGLTLSVARLGSTINMNVMVPIYEAVSKIKSGKDALGTALLIASITCVFSFICACILGLLDMKRSRIKSSEPFKAGNKMKFSDVLKFPLALWLLFIICVTFYCAVSCFISLAKVFFISKFGLSPKSANTANSLVYLVSAFASPVCGFLIDLAGFNVLWVVGAVIGTIGAHLLLTFTFFSPYYAMSLMGISLSFLATSLWPMIPLIVPRHQLGTAYGLMQSIQNLGLGIVNILSGLIVDDAGYFILEIFFLGSLCISLMAALTLYFLDRFKNGILGISAKKRKQLQKLITLEL